MAIEINDPAKGQQIIRCCRRCYFARGGKCSCSCGGLYPGKGLGEKKGLVKKFDRQESLNLC